MAKGYTSIERVAAYLGRDLTAGQQFVLSEVVLDAVEHWIDRVAQRAWIESAAVTDEYHRVNGPSLYLDKFPVASITSVTGYTGSVGQAGTALVAATDYELRRASEGLIVLSPGAQSYAYVLVSYTPAAGTPPEDVVLAATLIAAEWLGPALDPDRQGVAEYQIGQELRVRLREPQAGEHVPERARAIVESYAPRGGLW